MDDYIIEAISEKFNEADGDSIKEILGDLFNPISDCLNFNKFSENDIETLCEHFDIELNEFEDEEE